METEKEKKKLELKTVFNKKTIRKGIFYFVLISVVSLTGIFLYTNTGKTLEVWSKIQFGYLAIAFIFIVNDLLIGGWRNHIFAREFVPGISQWVCFRANLANIFMGAVTPSQTGGGPAQWYVLYKNGLRIPDLLTISIINWISTMIFFPLSGAVAYYVLQGSVDEAYLIQIVKFGFIVFATISSLFILALFFPPVLGKLLTYVANGVKLIKKSWGERLAKFAVNSEINMKEYQGITFRLLKKKPQLLFYSLGLTFSLYCNKYVLAFIFVLAFGVEADFWVVVSIQAIVYFILYFAPSPGGSGIAEVSLAGLMASVLATDYLASFALLYRSFLVFIPAMIGSIVVLRELNVKKK